MQPSMPHPTPLLPPIPRGIRKTRLGFFASILTALFAVPSLPAQDAVGQTSTAPSSIALNATQTDTTTKKQTKSTKTVTTSTHQTAVTEESLVVRGEEVPSAYGAPPALSRSRFSNLVNAYVLPPWAVFVAAIYEGDALRYNRPDHNYTAEIEMGLPYRFGIAIENAVETFRGVTQERSFSLEGRWAFADWDKIPLNPTIFMEYKFGIGDILHDEGPPAPLGKGEAQ